MLACPVEEPAITREELREATALLRSFLARYRKHLGRKEVQALVETYVTGLLPDTHKRNAEAMALKIARAGIERWTEEQCRGVRTTAWSPPPGRRR